MLNPSPWHIGIIVLLLILMSQLIYINKKTGMKHIGWTIPMYFIIFHGLVFTIIMCLRFMKIIDISEWNFISINNWSSALRMHFVTTIIIYVQSVIKFIIENDNNISDRGNNSG